MSTNATINSEIPMFAALPCMKTPPENARIFSLPPLDAFDELLDRTFPRLESDAIENDFTHLASTASLLDDGHYVFLVESVDAARIIYGLGDDRSTVFDIVIRKGAFQAVVSDLVSKWASTTH